MVIIRGFKLINTIPTKIVLQQTQLKVDNVNRKIDQVELCGGFIGMFNFPRILESNGAVDFLINRCGDSDVHR